MTAGMIRTLATSFSMLVILVHSVAASSQGCAGMVEGRGSASTRRLPDRLLVAYPGWAACDGDVDHAIRNGVNVIAWSFGALQRGPDGAARIVVQPDLDCIRHVANRHGGTIHLLSFGGWGSPHPDPGPTAAQYYAAWEALNEAPRHRRSDGSPLFDGFDWDLEGNDNPAAPTNTFKVETLQLMGEMSLLAKKAGYLVSLAPAESYLDARSPHGRSYSRSLLLDDDAWEEEFAREQGSSYTRPYFGYHGRNCWAYLVEAYGWEAFDFVSVQFYESYSHFAYDVQVAGVPLQEAIERAATAYYGGWVVDFSSDDDDRVSRLGTKTIAIPPARLVFGLGALHGRIDEKLPAERPPFPKIFTVVPSGRQDNPVARAFQSMLGDGLAPRGFMYWSIEEESGSSPSPFYMSRGLADVLGLEGKPPGLNDQ